MRVSSMSPAVGTWGVTSTFPWELPCPCASGAAVGVVPVLKQRKAVWGQATKPAAKIVLVGNALAPLLRSLVQTGADPSPATLTGW